MLERDLEWGQLMLERGLEWGQLMLEWILGMGPADVGMLEWGS
jgi:hypothetical protein